GPDAPTRPSRCCRDPQTAAAPWPSRGPLLFTSGRCSVPAVCLLVRPRTARRAVGSLDIAQAPTDLRGGVRLPVRPGTGRLPAGQRLRDPVGMGTRVAGVHVPAALLIPQRVQAGELARRPAVGAEHA